MQKLNDFFNLTMFFCCIDEEKKASGKQFFCPSLILMQTHKNELSQIVLSKWSDEKLNFFYNIARLCCATINHVDKFIEYFFFFARNLM